MHFCHWQIEADALSHKKPICGRNISDNIAFNNRITLSRNWQNSIMAGRSYGAESSRQTDRSLFWNLNGGDKKTNRLLIAWIDNTHLEQSKHKNSTAINLNYVADCARPNPMQIFPIWIIDVGWLETFWWKQFQRAFDANDDWRIIKQKSKLIYWLCNLIARGFISINLRSLV